MEDWLAEFFNNPWTARGIFCFLLIVTLGMLILWWRHGKRLKDSAQEIRDSLGMPEWLAIQDDFERWQAFASDHYQSAKDNLREMSKTNPLARQVLHFLKTCHVLPIYAGGTGQGETASDPTISLSCSSYLVERNIQLGLFRSFPNYLVGLGLCITFLGLAVVIRNAGHVLDSGQTANAIDTGAALRDLLMAASTKFWSSLSAVFFSIVYGAVFRSRSQWMEFQFVVLASDLRQSVEVLTPEELQYKSYLEIKKTEAHADITANGIGLLKSGLESTQNSSAEQHSLMLEKLSSVSDGLAEQLSQLGKEIGSRIGSMGDQMSGSLSKINEEAFADIARQMTESLHKATEVHLKTISERLEAVSAILARLPAEFDSLVGLLETRTSALVGVFTEAAEPIERSLSTASDSAREVAESFAKLPDALAPAGAAAKDLMQASGTVSEMVGRIASQNRDVVKRWEDLSAIVEALDTHLADSVEKIGGVFPAYAERLQEFSRKWEEAMSRCLAGLASNIRDLTSSHEEFRHGRSEWQDSAAEVLRGVEELKTQVVRFTVAMAGQVFGESPQTGQVVSVSADSGVEAETSEDEKQRILVAISTMQPK